VSSVVEPGDTPILALGGIVTREHGRPILGPIELATAGGSAMGNTGTRGVNVGGVGGVGC
jgi:hypothetical protein